MQIICGDITQQKADAIINAANGRIGCMGAGVAKAISKAGGYEIEKEAKKLCRQYKFKAGKTYFTKAGKLQCKYIIHAVTMEFPGQRCTLEIIEACLKAIFERAQQLNCKTVVIPGLGTKIGRVPLKEAAKLYRRLIPELENDYGIAATVCDIDRNFIKYLQEQ